MSGRSTGWWCGGVRTCGDIAGLIRKGRMTKTTREALVKVAIGVIPALVASGAWSCQLSWTQAQAQEALGTQTQVVMGLCRK
mgnify:CR=1 FL=1